MPGLGGFVLCLDHLAAALMQEDLHEVGLAYFLPQKLHRNLVVDCPETGTTGANPENLTIFRKDWDTVSIRLNVSSVGGRTNRQER